MTLFWVGMFALIAAWILAGKFLISSSVRRNTGVVDTSSTPPKFSLAARPVPSAQVDETAFVKMRTTMWAWIAPLLLAAPLSSRDVYSYLLQGAMVRDGFDPYTDRKSTRLNSSHVAISYAVFCLTKKKYSNQSL